VGDVLPGELLLDTIPAMAWSLEPDGRLDFLNRRWLDYTGLSMAEALAEPHRVLHPDDLPAAVAAWKRCLQTGQAYELEMRLRGADGQYRWFLVRTAPLRDDGGAIIKWYGTSNDVEHRHSHDAREQTGNFADLVSLLSLRELLVLKLVAEDMTSKEIAIRLGLKPATVDTYRSRVLRKLGVKGTAGLVRLAIRHGLIQP
jgi:PAS domain S-box-containing protein